MPTKKQKRRRNKDRRHEWEFVYVDDSGEEVEVDEEDERAAKPERGAAKGTRPAKASAKGSSSRSGRPARIPPEPSWNRSIKRSLPWQAVMIIVVVLLFKSMPLASRIMVAVVYGIAFVPFTYWVEKLAYNRYLRSEGKLPPKGTKKKS